MVLAATLVSTSFIVGAAITHGLDPAVLTLIRFMLAALLLLPLVVRYGLCFSWGLFCRCAIISCSLVIFFWCMFLALRYTSALNTSVIFTLVPSLAGIYALVLLKERLSANRMIALACGLAGALWVIFRGDMSLLFAMQWNRGDLIFLAGCLSMGLYTPLVQIVHRGESMVVMTFWVLVSGSCWLLLLTGSSLAAVEWAAVPGQIWVGIAYLSFFTTVVTFYLTQFSIPYLGATRVMSYSYLYPALVLVLEYGLGHGLPEARVLPGIVLVLVAMVVIQRENPTEHDQVA